MVLASCRGGREYKDGIILLFIYCYLVRFSVFDKKIKKRWFLKMEYGNIKKSKIYIRVNMIKVDLKCILFE